LAIFGSIVWLVIPIYAEGFSPAIIDHRSILFSPNESGGYTITEIPFIFETDLGEVLPLTDSQVNSTEKILFEFPFFGQQYQDIYLSNDVVLSFGSAIRYKDFQYNFSQSPAIIPLLLDLDPENYTDGKIYLNRKSNQLIITSDHVRSYYAPDKTYTFHSNSRYELVWVNFSQRSK
jgi:hypothetical protein